MRRIPFRLALTTAAVVAALSAVAPSAGASRLEAFATNGFCQFDGTISRGGSLGERVFSATIVRCVGGVPTTQVLSNNYLDERFGAGDPPHQIGSRNVSCGALTYECVASLNAAALPAPVSYSSRGDGTVHLAPAGSQKNPNGIRFTGSTDPSRCVIYNGGFSVWCHGLSDFVR